MLGRTKIKVQLGRPEPKLKFNLGRPETEIENEGGFADLPNLIYLSYLDCQTGRIGQTASRPFSISVSGRPKLNFNFEAPEIEIENGRLAG